MHRDRHVRPNGPRRADAARRSASTSMVLFLALAAGCTEPTQGERGSTGSGGGSGNGGGAGGGHAGVGGGGGGAVIGGGSGCGDAVEVAPLFATAAPGAPIVEPRDDGTIVTRAAGRVRGRHELEGTFSLFGGRYFENRSFTFVVEDTVAAGGGTVTVTYYPEAPVSTYGAQTNLRAWKVYGDGNVFHHNVTMETVTSQEQIHTIERNARANRPMEVGDVMEFEFGIFIAGNAANDPGAIEGRTAYYSDTFRYQVGVGGLTPDSDDSSGELGPEADARLGGDGTLAWIYAEPEMYFSQLALNVQGENVQSFLEGRRLFHTDFDTGAHSEGDNPDFLEQAGKLGPSFSAARCQSCHLGNGYAPPPEAGSPLELLAVRLYDDGPLGTHLSPQEGSMTLASYETSEVELADGTRVELVRPVYASDVVDVADTHFSVRVARSLTGLGLLEAIDEAAILAAADPDDCDEDGVSGRAATVIDPRDGSTRLGRFGWRAEKLSVEHQVADALRADMGVSTSWFPEAGGGFELADEDLERLTVYMQLLGVPPQRDADAPDVARGAELFTEVGCASCHAPSARTGARHPAMELRDQAIRPYTDLLLHDMGEGLVDPGGAEAGREWRTPPLWGIGLVETVSGHTRHLHDGRARNLLEAVIWHGGVASPAREAFAALPAADREALLTFLRSL